MVCEEIEWCDEGVTHSCMDESIYKINGHVYTNLNINITAYIEATALSLLVNRYPLRQRGSDVSNVGIDSFVFYAFKTLRTHSYKVFTVIGSCTTLRF